MNPAKVGPLKIVGGRVLASGVVLRVMPQSRRGRTQLVLVLATLVAVVCYLRSRHLLTTFIQDEWQFIGRRQDFSWRSITRDHNGHLMIPAALVYVSIFRFWGIDGTVVLNYLAIAGHLLVCLATSVVVWRRHGFPPAYVVGVLLAVSGVGAEIWSWGVSIGFSGSVLFFILAVLAFDKAEETGRLGWCVALCVAATLSLSSSGVGLAGTGVLVLMVLQSRRRWTLWWTVVLPVAAYLPWFAANNRVSGLLRPTFLGGVRYALDGMAASAGTVLGVGMLGGYIILVAIVALSFRPGAMPRWSVRRHAWMLFLAGFWAMNAYARGWFGDVQVGRYLWVGSMGVVMAAAESLPRWMPSRRTGLVLMAAVVPLLVVATVRTDEFVDSFRSFSGGRQDEVMARSTVAMRGRDIIDDSIGVQLSWNVPLLSAGEFFRAVDMHGPPATIPLAALSDARYAEFADKAIHDLGVRGDFVVRGGAPCIDGTGSTVVELDQSESATIVVESPTEAIVTVFLRAGERRPFNVVALPEGAWVLRSPDIGLGRRIVWDFGAAPMTVCG